MEIPDWWKTDFTATYIKRNDKSGCWEITFYIRLDAPIRMDFEYPLDAFDSSDAMFQRVAIDVLEEIKDMAQPDVDYLGFGHLQWSNKTVYK